MTFRSTIAGAAMLHRLYAESEDAGCMVGLQAAELPSVDETAITDTATSPPKPKNSAFNSGY
jgi:hypothetical protein